MSYTVIIVSALVLALLGLALGAILAYAANVFKVVRDPRIDQIVEELPGANCGACGFSGCAGFAEALIGGRALITGCPVSGKEARQRMSVIAGTEGDGGEKLMPLVRCHGDRDNITKIYDYQGLRDCRIAARIYGGPKECAFGCLGFGSCRDACPFGAIRINSGGLPVVDREICTGCGICAGVCPRKVIAMVPEDSGVHVLCTSQDTGKIVRGLCKVGCIKCRKCAKVCPAEAINFDGVCAAVDYDKCTQCGACVAACPTKSIILDKETVSFPTAAGN